MTLGIGHESQHFNAGTGSREHRAPKNFHNSQLAGIVLRQLYGVSRHSAKERDAK
jgi:hypothetical protein